MILLLLEIVVNFMNTVHQCNSIDVPLRNASVPAHFTGIIIIIIIVAWVIGHIDSTRCVCVQ